MKKQVAIIVLSIAVLMGCAKKNEAPQPDVQKAPQGAQPAAVAQETPESAAQALPPTLPSKIGDKAYPLAKLTWVKGQPTQITPGKIYVVEFWATWCPPCRVSIPHLTALQKKYKDRGVVIIGISQEDLGTVKPFVDKQAAKMDYNVAVDATGIVGEGYMTAFSQGGIPHAFVVDAEGKIAWHGHPMADLDGVLDKLLAAMAVAKG